jgi:hypothetical protein
MSRFSYLPASLLAKCALFSVILFQTAFGGDDWKPVTPADLQIKTPSVEPNADAEALFWEVRVDDANTDSLILKHYIRIKIFTERGREKYSKVDIPYTKGVKIGNVIARVIKPDGSIVEITKNDIFDREIVRQDKVKVRAKSFAVSGIEPGVIFEYQYQESIGGGIAEDMRMYFQHDVPIRTISYYFKPYTSVRYLTFNMDENKFEKDKNGFYRATLNNVPAIKEEPYMPPVDEIRKWLLVYYTKSKPSSATDFWSRLGGQIVQNYGVKDTLKPDKDIKSAAEQITAGAATQEEKIRKIFDFCKQKVKNISYDPNLTDDQKDEIKPSKSASDTYKKLQGRASDINELFAALSSALGFETRLAFGGDRSEKFFTVEQAHESFIHFSAVAVKFGNEWRFFSPGDFFLPFGMLDWREESTGVLLLGTKDYLISETPYSVPNNSVERRKGNFKLSEDGTLTGTVRIEYTGNLANERKKDNYKLSQNQQEDNLKEEIKQRLSTAEISSISIENLMDPEKPFAYVFNISVPNYAQKTGRRMFIQPGFFEYGKQPVFQTEDRTYPVFFHFPWSEIDEIIITLPPNFELESPNSPTPIGDPSGISKLDIRILLDQATNTLIYRRNFEFGNKGITLFPKNSYPPLKRLFDLFHSSDNHTLTLRQK